MSNNVHLTLFYQTVIYFICQRYPLFSYVAPSKFQGRLQGRLAEPFGYINGRSSVLWAYYEVLETLDYDSSNMAPLVF